MFTGIVEEVGKIQFIRKASAGMTITVSCQRILDDLSVDNSVAVDGVCQTVTSRSPGGFSIFAAPETLRKTTIQIWKPGQTVNLERALRFNSRLGGHLVQGHVDCVATVHRVVREPESRRIELRLPTQWSHLAVVHGSICVNGVSLTIARKAGVVITVSVIPFTLDATNLRFLTKGDRVNIETDIIGKYLYQFQKEST